jgi:hypothetical protein
MAYRDTFAVCKLPARSQLGSVSSFLGHSSVKVTGVYRQVDREPEASLGTPRRGVAHLNFPPAHGEIAVRFEQESDGP